MHKHGAGDAAQYARDLFRPAANDLYGVNAVIFRRAACHDMSGFVLYVDDITAGKFAGDSEDARWKQAVATRERLCRACVHAYMPFDCQPPGQPFLACALASCRIKHGALTGLRKIEQRIDLVAADDGERSEEGRVGKECVSPCRSRG